MYLFNPVLPGIHYYADSTTDYYLMVQGVKPRALYLLCFNYWLKHFIYELKMVTYSPSMWEAEAGGSLQV